MILTWLKDLAIDFDMAQTNSTFENGVKVKLVFIYGLWSLSTNEK